MCDINGEKGDVGDRERMGGKNPSQRTRMYVSNEPSSTGAEKKCVDVCMVDGSTNNMYVEDGGNQGGSGRGSSIKEAHKRQEREEETASESR